MRKRQQKKNQRRGIIITAGRGICALQGAYPVLQTTAAELNSFRGRLWLVNAEPGRPMYYMGVDPAAGLGETVFYTHTPPDPDHRLQRTALRELERIRETLRMSPERLNRELGNWPVIRETAMEAMQREARETEIRLTAGIRMQEIQRRPRPSGAETHVVTDGMASPPLTPSSLEEALVALRQLSIPGPRLNLGPRPPVRRQPLRRFPDPTPHLLIRSRELADCERNWQQEEPEPGGRWLMVPSVENKGPIVRYKKLKKTVPGIRLGGSAPAQMSAAEHRQWMIDNEREIDQYRGVEHHSGPFSWGAFWKAKAEGWDYDAWEQKRRKELQWKLTENRR